MKLNADQIVAWLNALLSGAISPICGPVIVQALLKLIWAGRPIYEGLLVWIKWLQTSRAAYGSDYLNYAKSLETKGKRMIANKKSGLLESVRVALAELGRSDEPKDRVKLLAKILEVRFWLLLYSQFLVVHAHSDRTDQYRGRTFLDLA